MSVMFDFLILLLVPPILLTLASKVVEKHSCNFPHYHHPPPPHHHHHHHHHLPPPQDVSGQSGFLESADKCTTASKPTHTIIVHKDDDDDNDDSDDSEDVINDDPNCTAQPLPNPHTCSSFTKAITAIMTMSLTTMSSTTMTLMTITSAQPTNTTSKLISPTRHIRCSKCW